VNLHHRTAQRLRRGRALQPYLAWPGPSPIMGKTEEVKAWQPLSMPQGLAGVIFPTSQQTRLVCIETQPEFSQPSRKDPHEPKGIVCARKKRQGIIRVPAEGTRAPTEMVACQ